MRPIAFLVGYLLIGVAMSQFFSAGDPEPIGALASLLLFCVASAATSLGSFFGTASLLKQRPSKLTCFLVDLVSSLASSLSVALVYAGYSLWLALSVAFAVPAAIGAVSSLVAQQASNRGRAA